MPHAGSSRFCSLQNRAAVFLIEGERRKRKAKKTGKLSGKKAVTHFDQIEPLPEKEMVESEKKMEYTLGSMNAQLANSYRWYRFTWHPYGWRGAFL
jgi:hypothetical protein